jgi:hypothetical protein
VQQQQQQQQHYLLLAKVLNCAQSYICTVMPYIMSHIQQLAASCIVMLVCMPFTASSCRVDSVFAFGRTMLMFCSFRQTCRQQEQLLATYGNIRGAGQQQQRQTAAAAAAAAGPGGPADEQQQQQQDALDDSLAQHFASIQELSDRQALEELLPRLQQVVGQVRGAACSALPIRHIQLNSFVHSVHRGPSPQ